MGCYLEIGRREVARNIKDEIPLFFLGGYIDIGCLLKPSQEGWKWNLGRFPDKLLAMFSKERIFRLYEKKDELKKILRFPTNEKAEMASDGEWLYIYERRAGISGIKLSTCSLSSLINAMKSGVSLLHLS